MAIPGNAPKEIGRAGLHDVQIEWQDGHVSIYPARELRLKCPCAACVDESTGVVRVIGTRVPQDVHPEKIHLVGRYAISIDWSDSHRTGIYSFDLLRTLCPCCRERTETHCGHACGCGKNRHETTAQ